MGKKQHQKDKMYLTCTEWSTLYGGKKAGSGQTGPSAKFRRLPFTHCSISMQPFEHPYCTFNGVIFDLTNIVPFLKKFGVNPVDGKKMSSKDLIKLNFFKNTQGKYHCPVTFKIFNENTHIVANKVTGNVFAHEAVEQLNIKAGFWRDLISDEPFTRKDIITIQDPNNLQKFNLADFYHIKKNIKADDEGESLKTNPRYHLKSVNNATKQILDQLDKDYKAPEKQSTVKHKADAINAAHYSTGAVAASFTSTAVAPATEHEAAIVDEDVLRYERVKKKGYVRLFTSAGILNIELHCDMVPRPCENFLKHCLNGYYKGTIFHRSIRNFMIQGGDPTGTGTGGESIWKKPFKDHFKPNLTHTGRGILSMANTGPDTNKSQFFITYRSARHLDGKHTVFGKVVGGLDTLDKMEKIEVDAKDKPKEDITLVDAQVFVNPYDEVDELLKKEREDALEKEAKDKRDALPKKITKTPVTEPKVYKQGIGKYINTASQKRSSEDSSPVEVKKSKIKGKSSFGDFSKW